MRIRELRERRGLVRVQVADALGVTQAAVYKWESGRASPSADKLPALAEVLNCTIDELYDCELPPSTEVTSR